MIGALAALACCAVIDDAGNAIKMDRPAHRIISLAPDLTEILFAIGAGNQVVGVLQGSDFPSAAKDIPLVGSYNGIDVEKIVSLHPDLIVTWGHGFSQQMTLFKKWGIPVYVSKPRALADITRSLKNIGCLAGTRSQAEKIAATFSHRLHALQQQYQARTPVTVFYQIGAYSFITINKTSWINQAIELCGGRNVFAHTLGAAPEVTWEAVIAANPQVVISDAADERWKSRWQHWPMISAVKEKKLFTIDADLIDRASPRILQGVQQMCDVIQAAR